MQLFTLLSELLLLLFEICMLLILQRSNSKEGKNVLWIDLQAKACQYT